MKAELRKVVHSAKLSRETECFAAEIWIDGAKAGLVENDGHGGAHRYTPHALEAQVDESAVNDLLVRHLEGKRLARMLKTKTIIQRDGKLYATKGPAPAGVLVLNAMPFDQALDLFLKVS